MDGIYYSIPYSVKFQAACKVVTGDPLCVSDNKLKIGECRKIWSENISGPFTTLKADFHPLSSHFSLILGGTDTGHAPEGAGEMRGVGITKQAGNFRDVVFRILQEIECYLITHRGE